MHYSSSLDLFGSTSQTYHDRGLKLKFPAPYDLHCMFFLTAWNTPYLKCFLFSHARAIRKHLFSQSISHDYKEFPKSLQDVQAHFKGIFCEKKKLHGKTLKIQLYRLNFLRLFERGIDLYTSENYLYFYNFLKFF